MARYYFHIHNRIGYVRDEEGEEVADLEAARMKAIDSVRSMLGDEARQGLIDLCGRIDIAEEAGEVLLVLPFTEAFELRLPQPGTEGP